MSGSPLGKILLEDLATFPAYGYCAINFYLTIDNFRFSLEAPRV
jgi:hypothetical protein